MGLIQGSPSSGSRHNPAGTIRVASVADLRNNYRDSLVKRFSDRAAKSGRGAVPMLCRYIRCHWVRIVGRMACSAFIALALDTGVAMSSARADEAEAKAIAPREIDEAVRRGVAFLWSRQN